MSATPVTAATPAGQMPYRVSDFFGMRTPLLPFTSYLEWAGDLTARDAFTGSGQAMEAAIRADRARMREGLAALIRRPEIREALYVASPSLNESLAHWLDAPDSARGLSAELVLVRYFERMTHRCTPFGLFAGNSTGRFAQRSNLSIGAPADHRRHTRLDRGLMSKVAWHLQESHALREATVLHPNTSLYRTAGRLRYVEYTIDAKGHRNYRLVAVTETPYLLDVLERAKRGSSIAQLAEGIAGSADATPEEAAAFIHELIDAQILVPDLELPITGPDAIDSLIRLLERFETHAPVAQALHYAMSQLRAMDRSGVGQAPDQYEHIADVLGDLPIDPDRKNLWQVDLFRPASELALGRNVAEEIERCAALLARITTSSATDSLTEFREAFRRRYGERWIPLMEALDPETGIGFPLGAAGGAEDLSLLAGFVAGASGSTAESPWSRRDVFLARRLEQVLARNGREWRLDESDLTALAEGSQGGSTLADSCEMFVRLLATSEQAVAEGDFRLQVQACYGPPGGRALGRFCYGDEALNEKLRAYLKEEASFRPDAILAEVVHLPHGRIGNVLSRPVLREYEIVFLGRSGAEPECQIRVSDLVIRVIDGRVVVWSPKHGKEILPRLTTALNSNITYSVSRFFGALKEQQSRNFLGWSWGRLKDESFLPRVTCGRIVLSRATWNFPAAELKALLGSRDAERFGAVQAWREKHGLPRFCLLVESDNELLIDLDNILSIDTFCDVAKGRPTVMIEECLLADGNLSVHGSEGGFTHELVVPLLAERASATPTPMPIRPPDGATQLANHLAPGSEWLFWKLYGGEGTADGVLAEVIAPTVADLRRRGVIDNWFFIRYCDPDPHLRLRLHGDPARLNGQALTLMHDALAPLLANGRLWRIELATYERETDRYGGPANIERAERLFGIDSDTAVELVNLCQGDRLAHSRWKLALAGVDRWLRDFGLDLEARRAFTRGARDGYVAEFRAQNKTTQRWFAERFRAERKALEPLVSEHSLPADDVLAAGLRALDERSRRTAPLLAEMRSLEDGQALATPAKDIAHALIHMFLNRTLRTAQRQQELVIYEFLARLYDSQWARRGSPLASQAE